MEGNEAAVEKGIGNSREGIEVGETLVVGGGARRNHLATRKSAKSGQGGEAGVGIERRAETEVVAVSEREGGKRMLVFVAWSEGHFGVEIGSVP